MDKLRMETPDLTAENVEKIAALFPNCVTEVVDEARSTDDTIVYKKGINFAVLKQMLSDAVVDGGEAYEFTWVGKKAAMVEANRPIRKTLRPCPEESKDWDTTENLYIEGDNLEVLKLLQESYLNKVKMIYIDPPYNTGNDFIYADDFIRTQDEENRQMGMFDEEENRLFKNTDSNGRFHSDWCSMMYSRLLLARNLLTEDGVIFISIDDNELTNLKKICDEVFGQDNFINQIAVNMNSLSGVKMTHAITGKRYPAQKEYMLLYKKGQTNPHLFIEKNHKEIWDKEYNIIIPQLERGQFESFSEMSDNEVNRVLSDMSLCSLAEYCKDNNINPSDEWKWKNAFRIFGSKSNRPLAKKIGNQVFTQQIVCYTNSDGNKRFFRADYNRNTRDPRIELVQAEANSAVFLSDCWIDISNDGGAAQEGDVVFPNGKKPLKLIKRIVRAANTADGIILDFFSGSATTAHAVMQLNAEDGGHRKFIMVQLPEVCDEKSEAAKAGYKTICDIGKERIRRAGEKIKAEQGLAAQNLDTGFRVLKLDESNMKDVFYAPEELSQETMYDMVSNIRDGRTGLDLLFGCLLDWGLPLSLPFSSETLDGCTVYTYNDGDLIACFDENVPESVVTAIARRKPLRAVFRDGCFASSPEKINVVEIFKNHAPTCAVKVL